MREEVDDTGMYRMKLSEGVGLVLAKVGPFLYVLKPGMSQIGERCHPGNIGLGLELSQRESQPGSRRIRG